MNQFHSPTLVLLVLVLVAWRLYARLRRFTGRQRMRPFRAWLAVVAFPLLLAFAALGARSQAESLAAGFAGLAVGVALGAWGLRLTRFEWTPQGLWYTPNLHLGIALSMLFSLRLLYRMMTGASLAAAGGPHDGFGRSPLTLAIFATLAGYYTAYAIGLLRRRGAVAAAQMEDVHAGS
jgi:hypothetical protein